MILIPLLLLLTPAHAATTCESLASLSLPDTRITKAQAIEAGGYLDNTGRAVTNVPAFCRVAATLTPTPDSDIRIEVWLPPAAEWNRKFQAVGNGGWAGTISYGALQTALKAGYATASTDTGHHDTGGAFVLGHPEKLIDFAWRSEHEMTVKAKAIIQAFYGDAPRFSYWNGCSTGGRQALKEAQMFPNDFDGIIAGAPGNRNLNALWVAHALIKDPAANLPKEKYALIHKAVLDACDSIDGVKDGLIDDPTRCKFDPRILLCKSNETSNCLTPAQVEGVRKAYTAPKHPATGKPLFGPLAPGSELHWGTLAAGPEPYSPALDQLRYVAFKDPAYDWRTFNFQKDVALFEKPEHLAMNATDPNLAKFFGHGGKLLIYQGWNDPNVSPYNTIRYFNEVQEALGGASKVANNIRLFMAPGMGHCSGGDGPNAFEKVPVLEQWVEQGKAPDAIIATHSTAGKIDRSRPLCPYPQVAKYNGTGSTDAAENYSCRKP
jgi:feruloyl esterase